MELIYRLIMFVSLALGQMLILNNVHLFNVATPLICVYFVITFRRNTPKWALLISCFMAGLIIDIFSNTQGLTAGCMTTVGMIQPYLLERLVPRDSVENLKASAATLGWGNFSLLCIPLTTLYCLLYFALESFTFYNWELWFLRFGTSTLLTIAFLMVFESMRSR